MVPIDRLFAAVVIVVWGLNFVVIKVGLQGVPPMLLAALRFTLVAFPAVFVVKRPKVRVGALLAYGATISFGQFALLFSALHAGMPAGLASLVLQSQAFFTLGFAALLLGEPVRKASLMGLSLAALGLMVIGAAAGHSVGALGFCLTLAAASLWGLGNIVVKRIGKVDMLGLVVWGALVPPVPFLCMSLWLEGPARMTEALQHLDRSSVLVVLYLALGATLVGYGLWGRLLSRYPASQVAPLSLLVPVVGILSASLFLHEALTGAQAAGAVLVMMGLVVHVLGARAPLAAPVPDA